MATTITKALYQNPMQPPQRIDPIQVGRGAGRTHRMMEWAVQAYQNPHDVVVVGPNTVVLDNCMRMAKTLLPRRAFLTTSQALNIRGWSGRMFIDHTVWEMERPEVVDELVFMAKSVLNPHPLGPPIFKPMVRP